MSIKAKKLNLLTSNMLLDVIDEWISDKEVSKFFLLESLTYILSKAPLN